MVGIVPAKTAVCGVWSRTQWTSCSPSALLYSPITDWRREGGRRGGGRGEGREEEREGGGRDGGREGGRE